MKSSAGCSGLEMYLATTLDLVTLSAMRPFSRASLRSDGYASFRFRHAKVPADLRREMFVHFPVPRNGGAFVLGVILPPGMSATLSEKFAAFPFEV